MKVYLTSDLAGLELKNYVKDHIQDQFDVIDLTEQGAEDFVDAAVKMVEALDYGKSEDLGIAFDAYGVGSFIAANKHQGMIVAEVSDERSAYMTRQHNNTKLITLGQEIVGKGLALKIVNEFLNADYDGGRHQVRVDMLNEMC
ncbi:galactose-6-phosphate isomerase subunit LacA [Ignavigranum ruoffiae]|uniref:galactose-6-phosphate isomerase subunit LacA n=1 Tax=Ignavigranum ruoffiae TaxID=89093 RepID=UPI0024ACDB07|nr:galactose-6-phosphate isomerase subunit LacA [Ignavigranum ruoffiae]